MSKKKISYITLSIAISIGFILLGIFCFGDSYKRLLESFIDLWNSIKFHFATMFNLDIEIVPTVIDFSHIFDKDIIESMNPLPPTSDDFIGETTTFFELFFSMDNFTLWSKNLAIGLGDFSKIMVIILPIILIVLC